MSIDYEESNLTQRKDSSMNATTYNAETMKTPTIDLITD